MGVQTTEATKHGMMHLVVSMLRERRLHMLDPLLSNDPKGMRVRLREQMETYGIQVKLPANTFQKERIALSGKVGGTCDFSDAACSPLTNAGGGRHARRHLHLPPARLLLHAARDAARARPVRTPAVAAQVYSSETGRQTAASSLLGHAGDKVAGQRGRKLTSWQCWRPCRGAALDLQQLSC